VTLTEILEQIRITMPIEYTNVTDAMLTKMVNQVYQEVADAYRWPWLEASTTINVTDGTQSYAVPSDFKYVVSVFETGEAQKALPQMSAELFYHRYSGDDKEAADADFFFLYDDKIFFYPTPSTTTTGKYTLTYYSDYTALSAGTDVPVFAGGFHYILVHGVAARLFSRFNNTGGSMGAYSMYLSYLENLRKHYNRVNTNAPLIWGDGNRTRRWSDPNLPMLDGA
jgi:hypothetical protein